MFRFFKSEYNGILLHQVVPFNKTVYVNETDTVPVANFMPNMHTVTAGTDTKANYTYSIQLIWPAIVSSSPGVIQWNDSNGTHKCLTLCRAGKSGVHIECKNTGSQSGWGNGTVIDNIPSMFPYSIASAGTASYASPRLRYASTSGYWPATSGSTQYAYLFASPATDFKTTKVGDPVITAKVQLMSSQKCTAVYVRRTSDYSTTTGVNLRVYINACFSSYTSPSTSASFWTDSISSIAMYASCVTTSLNEIFNTTPKVVNLTNAKSDVRNTARYTTYNEPDGIGFATDISDIDTSVRFAIIGKNGYTSYPSGLGEYFTLSDLYAHPELKVKSGTTLGTSVYDWYRSNYGTSTNVLTSKFTHCCAYADLTLDKNKNYLVINPILKSSNLSASYANQFSMHALTSWHMWVEQTGTF